MSNKSEKNFCNICDTYISSPALYDSHVQGRKHKKNILKKEEKEKLAKRSVYLIGFKPPISEDLVKEKLSEFGPIERLVVKKSGTFLFVEYFEEECAKRLLNCGPTISIGNDLIRIHKRKVDFKPTKETSTLELEPVLETLKTQLNYDSQLGKLIQEFGITEQMRIKRANIASSFESHLQKFFVERISLVLFGSTCTGLGTKFADAEINNNTPSASYMDISDLSRPPYLLSKLEPDELAKNRITKDEFDHLFSCDQSKLLHKLFNNYRTNERVISDLKALSYARHPIISFVYEKKLTFEVSIKNLLGEVKANVPGKIVNRDHTGTLKKFIFGLRVWAEMHSIFKDERYRHGVVKSYALTLFALSYLQQAGYLSPIKMIDEKIFYGWNIAYDFSFYKEFSGDELPNLFRNFFVFVINALNENKVHSIRDGRIYTKDEFTEKYYKTDNRIKEYFLFSLVNIQDPIELSHNVGSNISKHYLTLLRQKAGLSISKLKSNNFDFAELLLIPESRDASMKSNEKSLNIISIEFNFVPDNEKLINAINFLLEYELMFTNVFAPEVKRFRHNDEETDACSKIRYMATFCSWSGRRAIKSELKKTLNFAKESQEKKKEKELEIERLVSEELQRTAQFTENLIDLEVTIKQRDKIVDMFLKILGCASDQENINLFHFLELFLRNHLQTIVHGRNWNGHMNGIESNLMEVDS